eukprot:3884177-Rhodomonas_salina.2
MADLAYQPTLFCPKLSYDSVLRFRMSLYQPTESCATCSTPSATPTPKTEVRCQHVSYHVTSTDPGCHEPGTRCAVLRSGMVLRIHLAMCGTALGYGATHSLRVVRWGMVVPVIAVRFDDDALELGTAPYLPTRSLGDVRLRCYLELDMTLYLPTSSLCDVRYSLSAFPYAATPCP